MKFPSKSKLDLTKPHKGTLLHAYKCACEGAGLGYYYRGVFKDHPRFATQRGHTSFVVQQEGNEIETNNSRYTVIEREDTETIIGALSEVG
jgi:hypothetical protein